MVSPAPTTRRSRELMDVLDRYDEIADMLAALPEDVRSRRVLPLQHPRGAQRRTLRRSGPSTGRWPRSALACSMWQPSSPDGTTLNEERLVAAYRDEMIEHGVAMGSMNEVLEVVSMCQLHFALQWLGWARNWTPPAEHARDWLARRSGVGERAVAPVSGSKVLIVNADDFGQSSWRQPGRHRSAREGHRDQRDPDGALAGCHRSRRVREAAHPELCLGLHLDLAEWNYQEERGSHVTRSRQRTTRPRSGRKSSANRHVPEDRGPAAHPHRLTPTRPSQRAGHTAARRRGASPGRAGARHDARHHLQRRLLRPRREGIPRSRGSQRRRARFDHRRPSRGDHRARVPPRRRDGARDDVRS